MTTYKPIKIFNDFLMTLKNSKFPDFENKGIEVHKYLMNKFKNYSDPCSDRMKNIYLKFLDQIDYEKLTTLVTKEFYNIEVMKTMTCLINTVLTSEQDYIDYLTNPNVLKMDSRKTDLLVFFTAFLTGKDRILAFKYDKDNTLEEGMIGLLALNSMRSIIPTFAWIYGFTKCNLPIFTKSGNKYEIVTACRKKVEFKKKDYIGMISEYIKGTTIYEYIKTPQSINVQEVTTKEVLRSLLTILYSVKYANEKFKYVHWDLHGDNVLMRELDSNNSYIYLPDVDEYLWVGKHLATIIDYGLSSFEYEGKIISKYEFPELGINPELSTSPFNDFFKLINSLYSVSYNNYNKNKTNQIARNKFKTIQDIYAIFLGSNNANDIYEVQEEANKNYAIFPNAPNHTIDDYVVKVSKDIKTLDDMIDRIKLIAIDKNLNLITKNKPAVVLSCDKSPCIEEEMMEKMLMSREEPIALHEASLLSGRLADLNESDIEKQKDKKILEKFLVDYLDKIYVRVNKYINVKPSVNVDMIYLFNDLRIIENQLKILQTITEDIENRNLFDKIQKQKDIIYKLVNDIYVNVEKSLKDKEMDYDRTTYKPQSIKNASYLELQSDFDTLIQKSKNPPYIPPPQTKKSTTEPLFIRQPLEPQEKQKESVRLSMESSKQKQPSPQRLNVPSPQRLNVPSPKRLNVKSPVAAPVAAPRPVQSLTKVSTRTPSEFAVKKTQNIILPPRTVKSKPSKSELLSSIPLPKKEGPQILTSSVPLGKQESSPETKKNTFVSQLKKYERLIEGKKGVFIKSNLGKGKVQGMYDFVVENKTIVSSDPLLKSDIKKKMELIKDLDDKYVDMIDGYMKQLSL
jgi:hypothetical protein